MKVRMAGFTLIEMLVAIGIFSIVIGGLFTISDYAVKRSMAARKEAKKLLALTNFLSELSDSVKSSREILYISSREVGIWKEDKDGDGRPYTDETVSFSWDGRSPGNVYRRVGYDEAAVLNGVQSFELGFDEPAPRTRHVLMRVTIDDHLYQMEMAVREAK